MNTLFIHYLTVSGHIFMSCVVITAGQTAAVLELVAAPGLPKTNFTLMTADEF